MKKEIFDRFKTNNEIISIYVDLEDINAVDTGFVYEVNRDYLILCNLSKKCIYDGLKLFRLKDIFRVDYDTKYEQLFRTEGNDKVKSGCDIVINDDFILSFLKHSKDNHEVISVCIEVVPNTGITGIVEEYSEDTVVLGMYNEDGEYEGKTCININDISNIHLDTNYERKINQLINWFFFTDQMALIGVKGRIETSSYEKDGEMKYQTNVIAEKLTFLSSNKEKTEEKSEDQEMNM